MSNSTRFCTSALSGRSKNPQDFEDSPLTEGALFFMTSYCKNFQMIFSASDGNRRLLARSRCKMWTCSHCAQVNRAMWRARIIDYVESTRSAESDEPVRWSWFTLTAHSRMRGPKKSIDNLRAAWDTLMKRMKRRFGKFSYVRVFEKHRDGSFHIHAIANFHFGDIRIRNHKNGSQTKYSTWLQQAARDLSLGRYTHADDLPSSAHGGFVASYITKYVTKLEPSTNEALGRVRNIQCSHDWPKLQRASDLEWLPKTGYYEPDFTADVANGVTAVDIATGTVVTSDDFLETFVWPPEFGDIATDAHKPRKPRKKAK